MTGDGLGRFVDFVGLGWARYVSSENLQLAVLKIGMFDME